MEQENLILGFDLCNDYSQVAWYTPDMPEPEPVLFGQGDHPTQIATAVCRRRGRESWVAGEDASRAALLGDGSIVDKLLKLVAKDGTATIENVRYTAEDLLQAFLETTLNMSLHYIREQKVLSEETPGTFDGSQVRMLVFSLQTLDRKLMDMLVRCAGRLGIARDRVRIQSHSESFGFYVASQKLDIWANQVGLFDLTREGLYFYQFQCMRGIRPNVLQIACTQLEEGFSLDLLDTEPGRRLADSILTPCAERMMQRRVFSAVLLGGQGFAECAQWADSFLKYICTKRRVYMTEALFARGAAYLAMDSCRETTRYPYQFECGGRLHTQVSLEVKNKGLDQKLVLAGAGMNWYDADKQVEILVNGAEPVELLLEPGTFGGGKASPARRVQVSLADFPAREGYTTRISLSLSFQSEDRMVVEVRDMGFGQIFPSSGRVSRQEIGLGTGNHS